MPHPALRASRRLASSANAANPACTVSWTPDCEWSLGAGGKQRPLKETARMAGSQGRGKKFHMTLGEGEERETS